MSKKSVFRTRLLILPQFQLKLLGANLAILSAVTAIIWLQMNSAFTDLTATAGTSGIEAEFYHRYLAFQARSMNLSLGFAFITALVVSTVLTLMISHRFSGPMVRLRGYFRDLGQCGGQIAPLSFRKNDVLSYLPPLVNQAVDHLLKAEKHSITVIKRRPLISA